MNLLLRDHWRIKVVWMLKKLWKLISRNLKLCNKTNFRNLMVLYSLRIFQKVPGFNWHWNNKKFSLNKILKKIKVIYNDLYKKYNWRMKFII
jgi:hypothetical protein